MKTYIYVKQEKENNRNNNPSSTLRLYRLTSSELNCLADCVRIGYRDTLQAAEEEITKVEKMKFSPKERKTILDNSPNASFSKDFTSVHYTSGWCESVAGWRSRRNKIKIFRA